MPFSLLRAFFYSLIVGCVGVGRIANPTYLGIGKTLGMATVKGPGGRLILDDIPRKNLVRMGEFHS
jgi:hypothetical protein